MNITGVLGVPQTSGPAIVPVDDSDEDLQYDNAGVLIVSNPNTEADKTEESVQGSGDGDSESLHTIARYSPPPLTPNEVVNIMGDAETEAKGGSSAVVQVVTPGAISIFFTDISKFIAKNYVPIIFIVILLALVISGYLIYYYIKKNKKN